MTLMPVDPEHPRLGGKVIMKGLHMNFETMVPSFRTKFGIYGEDFIQYGEYNKDVCENPLDNEEMLIKINDSSDLETVIDKTTLRFKDNKLFYQREINSDLIDADLHPEVQENMLIPLLTEDTTWTEMFFYNVGNRRM